jgi:hypothetical protein
MRISLISAPVLGYDLVRHPQGDAVAGVLLRALACGPDELEVFASARARTPEGLRTAAWAEVRDTLRAAWSASGARQQSDASLSLLITELRSRMILELDDLRHLISADILAWCGSGANLVVEAAQPRPDAGTDPRVAGDACDAFVDAIAAVWTEDLPDATRRLLAAPFLAAGRAVPWREPDLGPRSAEVHMLLARLGSLDEDDRTRLRATSALRRAASNEWANAVHEASWATVTTGRTRACAATQLLAVRAFTAGGLDALDGAEGVWNAVSGHLHATVVADVLEDATAHRLARVWDEALGEH